MSGGYSFANKANLKELVAQQENKLFSTLSHAQEFQRWKKFGAHGFACRWRNLGGSGREGGRLVGVQNIKNE